MQTDVWGAVHLRSFHIPKIRGSKLGYVSTFQGVHQVIFVAEKTFFGLHTDIWWKNRTLWTRRPFFLFFPILGVHERIRKLSKGTDEQKVWKPCLRPLPCNSCVGCLGSILFCRGLLSVATDHLCKTSSKGPGIPSVTGRLVK